jgi:hypothetical protein
VKEPKEQETASEEEKLEEEEPPAKPTRAIKQTQRQTTKKAPKKEVSPETDSQGSDIEREEQSLQKRKAAKRKRQKPHEQDSELEEHEQIKQSQKAKLPAKVATEEADSEIVRKKTKRKLNVFDNQTTFQWDSVQVRYGIFPCVISILNPSARGWFVGHPTTVVTNQRYCSEKDKVFPGTIDRAYVVGNVYVFSVVICVV